MIENYRIDTASGVFSSSDTSSGNYAKMFSVKKSYGVNVIFSLIQSVSNIAVSYKRLAFVSGSTPNLYDFDIEASGITVKVIDDGTSYVIYAKIPNTVSIKLKIIQCDTPNLIKFYPNEVPVSLPSTGDITNKASVTKSSVYFSILNLITYSGDFQKQFSSQVIITDGNEISGHLYVKGTQSGDGTQICTMPVPLYIGTESLFQTFTAQYQSSADSLWYGCTVRLDNTGALKIYGLGANAPSYVSLRVNLHYRCSQSVINQYLTTS
jgi:hypothetical protein